MANRLYLRDKTVVYLARFPAHPWLIAMRVWFVYFALSYLWYLHSLSSQLQADYSTDRVMAYRHIKVIKKPHVHGIFACRYPTQQVSSVPINPSEDILQLASVLQSISKK